MRILRYVTLFAIGLLGVVFFPARATAQGVDCDKCADVEEPIYGWGHEFDGVGAHFDGIHGGMGPDICSEWHDTCIPDDDGDFEDADLLVLLDAADRADAGSLKALEARFPVLIELDLASRVIYLRDCQGDRVGFVPIQQ